MAKEVQVIDRGWKRIQKALAKAGFDLKVGVIGSRATQDRGGITNAEIAAIHEFGAANVPQRSFIRSTFNENLRKYKKAITAISKSKTTSTANLDTEGQAEKFGAVVKQDIENKIKRDQIPPPLSPRTVANKIRKGSANPRKTLVDEGILGDSISVEVKTR